MSDDNKLLAPGHNACPGCGVAIGVKLILRSAGKNTIVCSPTGCLETFTSPYGASAWEVPWIHSLFENAPAVATGIKAALEHRGSADTNVIVIGGDGATFDIGFGSLSGMFEREDDILYVCYDNEAYMNTGIQRSSATPLGAATTTTPAGRVSSGERHRKKDMIEVALAHNVPYIASASISYPRDLAGKVKKGLAVKGPAYIHLLVPCNIGWGIKPEDTIEFGRAAVKTALFPLVEFENGVLTKVRKFSNILPVEEYLANQGRFSHLFQNGGHRIVEQIQKSADENVKKYGLLSSDEG